MESIFGQFTGENIEDGQKAVIVIRHEGLLVSLDKNGVEAIVMESHLLGRSSLLHLTVPDEKHKEALHLHARIPGLNSFKEGERIHIQIDPAHAFVFPDTKIPEK